MTKRRLQFVLQATAEDMPDASFAGQQETFLNVKGLDAVKVAVKHVFASLFNDRAIRIVFTKVTTTKV